LQRVRIIAGLIAALATTALFAASASAAAPEYGRCLAHTGGKWKTSGCTTAAKPGEEKFEWYPYEGKAANGEEKPVVKKSFSSKSTEGTLIQLEGTGEANGGVRTKVVCKEQTSEGEVTGRKTNVASNIAFTGCESSGAQCTTFGAAEGEVRWNDLEGQLAVQKFGYNKETKVVEPAKNKIANEYRPNGTEEYFTNSIECAGLRVQVKGHVLVPVPANKMVKATTVKFNAPRGNQKPEHVALSINTETGQEAFGPELSLEAIFETFHLTGFEESGQTLTTVQTNEEALEINTVI
jgi:hypothetical protein